MRRLLLASLLAGACSPSDLPAADAPSTTGGNDSGVDPNEGATSGSRLKLTWINFADGTRTWSAFYDAQRKENCYLYEGWADGGSYCTPDTTGSVVYTDAACTQRAIQIYKGPTCSPPSPYAVEYNAGPCASQPAHLWLRGSPITVASYYDRFSDGSCGGPYPSGSYDMYAVGGEVPTSDLVRVMLGAPAGAARLGLRFYQSADGMKLPWIIHDAMLGVDCYPAYTPDYAADKTCAPTATYAYDYHDAGCSQPELEVSKSCATPQYMVSYPANICPDQPGQYFTVGAAISPTPLYTTNGASCTTATASAAMNYFLAGQPLSLAPVMRSVDATPGHRIQLAHYTTTDGLKLRDYALFDQQDGASCYPEKLPDGTMRCVPFGGYIQTFYTNAQCTSAIDLVAIDLGPTGCAAPTVPKYARKYISPPPGSCTYSTEVHPISTPYAGTVYQNFGTCAPYNQSTSKLYSIGPAIPTTDFVMAAVTIDP